MANIFYEASTRTAFSFETAMYPPDYSLDIYPHMRTHACTYTEVCIRMYEPSNPLTHARRYRLGGRVLNLTEVDKTAVKRGESL